MYFWLGVKHQSFLQVDTMILGVGNQVFCMHINMKDSLQIDTMILMEMIKHSQS